MSESEIEKQIRQIARDALVASRKLAAVPEEQKNRALHRIALLLESPEEQRIILQENQRDLHAGEAAGLSRAMLDRLALSTERLFKIAQGVRDVENLPDPVGDVIESHTHPKGFLIEKVRVPIGVIGIVYESRPNVTIDCAVLCLKSGNATILRGGREAINSNLALAKLVNRALELERMPLHSVQLIPSVDRYALSVLMKCDDCIHCLIPRGGEGLIRFVAENARMPVIKHYKGVCNIYLDTAADPHLAESITINAKVQRPGVCNAVENLIIHESLLKTVFPTVAKALSREGVELRVDEPAMKALKAFGGTPCIMATPEDYDTEYLDKIISIKTVPSTEAAIDFINTHGSGHSDAIVTKNEDAAQKFRNEVDSATVYWNVSTRFTDGFEFGMGAEIGISTDKLHARGPMGLVELTSYKYCIKGNGEIRG